MSFIRLFFVFLFIFTKLQFVFFETQKINIYIYINSQALFIRTCFESVNFTIGGLNYENNVSDMLRYNFKLHLLTIILPHFSKRVFYVVLYLYHISTSKIPL